MMNNIETKTFAESPFRALKILTLILGGVFLVFGVIIFLDETPGLTENGELNSSAFLLVIELAVFSIAILFTFLILSFQYRKKVECNSEGCEVRKFNFWKNSTNSDSFKWNKVSDTMIAERDFEVDDGGIVSVYSFEVKVDDRYINLLDLKTSSSKTIENLIHYVNNATPQLKHIWLHKSHIQNRQVLADVHKYRKVART